MKELVSDTLWVRHGQVGKNIFYWLYILRIQNIVFTSISDSNKFFLGKAEVFLV